MENRSRASALYDELIRNNAMTDEVTRYIRKTWRGGGSGSTIANVIVGGMLALLYAWLLSAIVRWELFMTIGIEYAELAAVTLIAPSAMYAAISGEREKATWDALVLTRLTPAQIITGKLAWRAALLVGVMALMLLLVVASQTQRGLGEMPDAGGVVVGQLLILSWGLMLMAFSLWISAKTARSVTSIGVIISVLLGVVAMLPALISAFGLNFGPDPTRTAWDEISAWILAFNPFALLGPVSMGPRAVRNTVLNAPSTAVLASLVYLAGAALFVWLTHGVVRRLSGE